MKQLYHVKPSRAKQVLLWLLPSGAEVAIYLLLAFVSILFMNIDSLREFLLVPEGFSLQTSLLAPFEDSLASLVGARMASTLLTAVFWGLVGLVVYLALWALGNFSTELSNDLVITKYMHPRGDDTFSPLKGLILKVMFHISMAILLVLYANFFITRLLPFISGNVGGMVLRWNDASYLLTLIKILLIEILAIHLFVVFTRLLLLKKRVFGSVM